MPKLFLDRGQTSERYSRRARVSVQSLRDPLQVRTYSCSNNAVRASPFPQFLVVVGGISSRASPSVGRSVRPSPHRPFSDALPLLLLSPFPPFPLLLLFPFPHFPPLSLPQKNSDRRKGGREGGGTAAASPRFGDACVGGEETGTHGRRP